ncbi:hypothetical protein [Paenibacillus elgii]|nr:hypothetical protein [Paenibacillus elgii]
MRSEIVIFPKQVHPLPFTFGQIAHRIVKFEPLVIGPVPDPAPPAW